MFCHGISTSSIEMYSPAILDMMLEFKCSEQLLKISIAISPFVSAFAGIFYGSISDVFGRRIVFLSGLMIFLIGSFLCGLSTSPNFFIFSRIVQALGGTSIGIILVAILGDKFHGKKFVKYLGFHSFLFPISFAIAPNIGAFILKFTSWHGIFYFISTICLIIWIVLYLYLPETLEQKRIKRIKNSFFDFGKILYKLIFRKKVFIKMVFLNSFAIAMSFFFFCNAPFMFLEHFKFSQTQFANIMLIPNVSAFIGCLFFNILIRYKTPKFCQKLGGIILSIFVVSYLLFFKLIDKSAYSVVLFYSIAAIGSSFLTVTSAGFALSSLKDERGLGNGLINFFRNIISSGTVMVMSGLIQSNVNYVMSTLVLISSLIIFTILNSIKKIENGY